MKNPAMTWDYSEAVEFLTIDEVRLETSGSGFNFQAVANNIQRTRTHEPKLISLDCEKCGGDIEMRGDKGYCTHCGHRVMVLR